LEWLLNNLNGLDSLDSPDKKWGEIVRSDILQIILLSMRMTCSFSLLIGLRRWQDLKHLYLLLSV